MINSDIIGEEQVGSVAGDFQGDSGKVLVSGCVVSKCTVTGSKCIGGLVGRVVKNSTVTDNNVSDTTVTGSTNVGDVVGLDYDGKCTINENQTSQVTLNNN